METTANAPVVLPMWLTGFERLMPEKRPFPYKYFPRFGTRLTITFGDPIPPAQLRAIMSPDKRTTDDTRKDVTALVHDHVENLGRAVCDNPSRFD